MRQSKKFIQDSDFLAKVLLRQSFEFETRLTPQECAENLKRLPNPSEFVAAKEKAKFKNRGFPTKIVQTQDGYSFTVELFGRYRDAAIEGTIGKDKTPGLTVIQGQGVSNPKGELLLSAVLFGGLLLSSVFSWMQGISSGGFVLLLFTAMGVLVFSLWMIVHTSQESIIVLIQEILTNEEEHIWRRHYDT